MLVVSLGIGKHLTLSLADGRTITVWNLDGRAKLGVDAPRDVPVVRSDAKDKHGTSRRRAR